VTSLKYMFRYKCPLNFHSIRRQLEQKKIKLIWENIKKLILFSFNAGVHLFLFLNFIHQHQHHWVCQCLNFHVSSVLNVFSYLKMMYMIKQVMITDRFVVSESAVFKIDEIDKRKKSTRANRSIREKWTNDEDG